MGNNEVEDRWGHAIDVGEVLALAAARVGAE
jgi:hypothetical protein